MHTGYGKKGDGTAIARILHPIEDMHRGLAELLSKMALLLLYPMALHMRQVLLVLLKI